MKHAAIVVLCALALNVNAKEPNWRCARLASRDQVCVDVNAVKPSDGNWVAPFLMVSPDGTRTAQGHSLEVKCNGTRPMASAMRDRHGSRYGGSGADMPAHTLAIAEEVCEAQMKQPKGDAAKKPEPAKPAAKK